MKRIYLFTLLVSFAFAEEPSYCEPTIKYPPIMQAGYNRSSKYIMKNQWNLLLFADVLYWQAREDNLVYAVSTQASPASPPLNGEAQNVDFDWHPGARVGFGFFVSHDQWNVQAIWTHLISHNNTQSTAALNESLLPTKLHPQMNIGPISANSAFSSWKVNYNTIDLLLGRPYFLGNKLILHPLIGLRGYWIDQTYNVSYEEVRDVNQDLLADRQAHQSFDSRGIGPKSSLKTEWILGEGFRLLGGAGAGLFYTWIDVKQKETTNNQTLMSFKNKDNDLLKPTMDALLGFSWGSFFSDQYCHLDVSVMYELHYWWHQNTTSLFLNDNLTGSFTSFGNLCFHGGTLRFRLDF